MSAGRLYDKIGKKATAKVVMLTNAGVICKICKKVCWSISSKIKKSRKAKSRLNRIKRVSQRFHSICYTDFNNEKGERYMPKGTNQKFKLYRLAQIMQENTDDSHYMTMPEIMVELKNME